MLRMLLQTLRIIEVIPGNCRTWGHLVHLAAQGTVLTLRPNLRALGLTLTLRPGVFSPLGLG